MRGRVLTRGHLWAIADEFQLSASLYVEYVRRKPPTQVDFGSVLICNSIMQQLIYKLTRYTPDQLTN